LRARAALALLLAAGAAAAQNTNDPRDSVMRPAENATDWGREQRDRDWQRLDVQLPAYPKDENLIEFVAGPRFRSFRYFIDASSLTVGKDNLVMYALVARSPSGFANVTYEGMRCDNGSYRVLAFGEDGRWAPREQPWREVEPRASGAPHAVLSWDFFCPMRGTILSGAEGVDALRRGMHPGVSTRPGY